MTLDEALRFLVESDNVCLDSVVYRTRDCEGLGWTGPDTKACGDAIELIREYVRCMSD